MPYRYLVLALLLPLAACDSYTQDDYETEYIVESYLVAGEPLPPIRLSRTGPVDAPYDFDEVAVEDAAVAVMLLDESGGAAERFAYEAVAPGVYEPVDPSATVRPLRSYALEVRVPGEDEVIRSTTLVPGTFELLGLTADTLVYQGPEQLEARVTRSEYPGRQTVYLFTLEALDTTNALTPLYADFVDDEDEDDGPTKADFIRNSSDLTNESFFEQAGDGTLSLTLPWVAVAFYGPTRVVASALDDNLHDFKRSQGSGGTTSPGERDNLIDHVEGGRGIFGSMARDAVVVHVVPRAPGGSADL